MPFDPVRSQRAEVRNPLLAVPGVAEDIEALARDHPEAMAALRSIAMKCSRAWHAKGEECWRRSKPPMAAYWRAWGVNARHLAALCRPTGRGAVR